MKNSSRFKNLSINFKGLITQWCGDETCDFLLKMKERRIIEILEHCALMQMKEN
jgi:hypothetical protein